MNGRFSATIALLVTLLLPPQARAAEPIERTSEVLQTPSEAWAEPGFRVQLRVGSEQFTPLNLAPQASGISLTAEPGIRLSRFWSLSAALRYTILDGDMSGLRWTTTVDLGFHPWGGLFMAAGVGYAGILAQSFGLYSDCMGSGVAVVGRLGWLFPVGELFATGPVIQTDLQWTRCGSDDEIAAVRADDFEDGDWMVMERPASTWRHRSLHFAWSLAWR